jgi:hypothetical protein
MSTDVGLLTEVKPPGFIARDQCLLMVTIGNKRRVFISGVERQPLAALANNLGSVEDFSIWDAKLEGPLLKPASGSEEKLNSWTLIDEHICFQRHVYFHATAC